MPVTSIADPAFEYDPEDPEGFRAGMVRLGPGLGAERTGMSVYELPPGQSLCPYHYEWGEEEWLVVLAGTPTLRTPEGERTLAAMDVAFFERGPAGAHEIRNDAPAGGGTVRLLMASEVVHPSATVYPDSDKIGIWTGDKADDLMVRRSSGVGYYTDQPPRGSSR